MDWTALITAILAMLENCGSDAESRRRALDQPLRMRLGARRLLREQGLRGAELRDGIDQVMAEREAASEEELMAMCHDCDDCD